VVSPAGGPSRIQAPSAGVESIPRTLVVTGHFPPEPGGVQTVTYEMVRRLPADRIVVVGPYHPHARQFDEGLDFPVYRRRGYLLTPGLRRIVLRHGLSTAWITAAAPFGLYAGAVRRAGITRIVASSHGQELGWLRVPPTRWALRRVIRSVDVLTYLTPVTRHELEPIVQPGDVLAQLAGGIDTDRFHPGAGGALIRARLGLHGRPMVVSVSRLVRRKGHDVLLRAWPEVLRAVPDAALVVVGDGPMRSRLQSEADEPALGGSVVVTGPVPAEEVPAYLDAGDVFVLPSRDTRRGLQREGLGLATLEASATGLPVVVGRSGGSVDALVDGLTGRLVDTGEPGPVAAALVELLTDAPLARRMGEQGRRWVSSQWTWAAAVEQLVALLRGDAVDQADQAGVAGESGSAATAGPAGFRSPLELVGDR
jgi:phosphatidyl-myo-inositol dimannoside synthase